VRFVNWGNEGRGRLQGRKRGWEGEEISKGTTVFSYQFHTNECQLPVEIPHSFNLPQLSAFTSTQVHFHFQESFIRFPSISFNFPINLSTTSCNLQTVTIVPLNHLLALPLLPISPSRRPFQTIFSKRNFDFTQKNRLYFYSPNRERETNKRLWHASVKEINMPLCFY
jgi:hypothetical protein